MASPMITPSADRLETPPRALRLAVTRGDHGTVHKFGTAPRLRHQLLARLDDERALAAVAVIRREIARFLAESSLPVDPELIDDAVLCLDELVTNSLTHTESRVITVNAGVRASATRGVVVRVVVGDEDRRRPTPSAPRKNLGTEGRGLTLLTALSDWGWRRCSHGKDIWFECSRRVTGEPIV